LVSDQKYALLEEPHFLASCNYEIGTKWGEKVGRPFNCFIFFSHYFKILEVKNVQNFWIVAGWFLI